MSRLRATKLRRTGSEGLKIGERFRRRIDEVIRVHDKLLLILSEHSVASSWVEKEVETGMESEDEQMRTVRGSVAKIAARLVYLPHDLSGSCGCARRRAAPPMKLSCCWLLPSSRTAI